MLPEHEIAGEWRSWQRTCFGSTRSWVRVPPPRPSGLPSRSTRVGLRSAGTVPDVTEPFKSATRRRQAGSRVRRHVASTRTSLRREGTAARTSQTPRPRVLEVLNDRAGALIVHVRHVRDGRSSMPDDTASQKLIGRPLRPARHNEGVVR